MPIVSAGSGVEAVFTQSVTLGRANLPLTFTKYHRQFKPLSEYSKCYSSKSALISRKCKLKDCATFRRLEQNFDNDNKIRQFRFVCEIRSHYTHSSVLWNHTMGSCIFFIMLKSKATARKSIIVCTSFFFNCQAKYKVSLRFFFPYYKLMCCSFSLTYYRNCSDHLYKVLGEVVRWRPIVRVSIYLITQRHPLHLFVPYIHSIEKTLGLSRCKNLTKFS